MVVVVVVGYKVSNADLISGRDCKDSMVELDRSDVAEMLDGVSGGAGRRQDGIELVVFELISSSCEDDEEDEEDQKDRDGCVVGWYESDGGESCLKLLLLDKEQLLCCPLALSLLLAPAVRGDGAETDAMRR